MENVLAACSSGLDLLTVYLLVLGFTRGEIADLLHTSPPVITRRLARIYRAYQREIVP